MTRRSGPQAKFPQISKLCITALAEISTRASQSNPVEIRLSRGENWASTGEGPLVTSLQTKTKLPMVSAREAIHALAKKGYEVDRQTGSHIILRQGFPPYRRLTIPNHKELAKGTLRAILRQAGMTVEEFAALL